MDFITEKIGEITIIILPGDNLDSSNVSEFREQIDTVIQSSSSVVFDLRHVKFVDSSGLGAILSCMRRLKDKGGDLKLCRMTKQVRVLAELVNMHKIFEIFETGEEAVRAF